MRAFRLRPLSLLPCLGLQRYYGDQSSRGGRPPSAPGGQYSRGGGPRGGGPRGSGPRGGGPPPGNRNVPNEPQIIARLLERFPKNRVVPIGKWASSLPDELQEALVPYGGLSGFTRSQANFFIVRQENGVTVASLSPMGTELQRQHTKKLEREQKKAEKEKERQGRFAARGRGAGPYVPPSQRK